MPEYIIDEIKISSDDAVENILMEKKLMKQIKYGMCLVFIYLFI